jgi:hypothetical protein
MTAMALQEIFDGLRPIMSEHADSLDVKTDAVGDYYLDTHHIMKNGKPLFFGAVQIKARFVSFHLMPVYVNPGLLDGISEDLRKRMHGKSCFNFRKVDTALFRELADLTRAGYRDYKAKGYISS